MTGKMITALAVGIIFACTMVGIIVLASMKRTNSLQRTLFNSLIAWAGICFTTLVTLLTTGLW